MYLDAEKADNSIKIYPLPATEKIFIELNHSHKISEILIHDINQKVVYQNNDYSNQNYEVNISKLDSGVYFVVLIAENEKIIKLFQLLELYLDRLLYT